MNSVAFSPDGTHLATASEDGTSRIWNTTTGGLEGDLVAFGSGWLMRLPPGDFKYGGSVDDAVWWQPGSRRLARSDLADLGRAPLADDEPILQRPGSPIRVEPVPITIRPGTRSRQGERPQLTR